MKLTFLGSGDAFGSGGRLQTSILADFQHSKCLIDCGATVQIAIRKFAVDPNEITTIFLTHLHGDHFGGIPFFLLDAQMISKRTEPLIIAGPPGTEQRILAAMEALFPGSSQTKQKFALSIRELELERPTSINGLTVTAYPVSHPGGQATALRLECDGKIIVYTGDTEWTDALIPASQGADLLISEAYCYEKQVKFHLDYLTLKSHIPQLQIKKLIITHMSTDMLSHLDEIDCEYAYDGKEIEI